MYRLAVHYPPYSGRPGRPFACSNPSAVARKCGHPLVDFLQSEHSSSIFSWCWSVFILREWFWIVEVSNVLFAEWGWKILFEVKLQVLLVSFGFLCFWRLSYMFILLYLLFLGTLQNSQFTFASRLLEVVSDDCLQGKLPHWMNKSWGVYLLTSYPSHVGHGAPCSSFRLIYTMSFVSTLRSLQRRRLNIQWHISCPKSDNLRSSANSSICQKLYWYL